MSSTIVQYNNYLAKPGPVQIRHTLLDAVVLSSRVKTESIQYEFMTVVISSLRALVRTK